MFQRSETTKIAVWSLDSGVRTSHRDIKFVWVRLWINSTKTKIFTIWQSYFEYFSCQIHHYKYRYIQCLKRFPMNFHSRRVPQNAQKSCDRDSSHVGNPKMAYSKRKAINGLFWQSYCIAFFGDLIFQYTAYFIPLKRQSDID